MPDSVALPGGFESPSIDGTYKFPGINAKVAGPILLGNLPSKGRVFVVTQAFVAMVAGAGITTVPQISCGTDAGVWANIINTAALTGLAPGNVAPVPLRAQYPWITAGQAINLNIVVAGIAPGAITLVFGVKGEWV